MVNTNAIKKAIEEHASTRSVWRRAIKADALDLLDSVSDYSPAGRNFSSSDELRAALLNGARDWFSYSYGGCALIYDTDIAEHYCTPSELKRRRGGEWQPSIKETWLDVQARALNQAARLIVSEFQTLNAIRGGSAEFFAGLTE